MLNKIYDYIFDFASSSIKFLIVISSLIFAGYSHFINKIEKKAEETKKELLIIRQNDVKIINEEVTNIKEGIQDLKESNKIILNHLLRRP